MCIRDSLVFVYNAWMQVGFFKAPPDEIEHMVHRSRRRCTKIQDAPRRAYKKASFLLNIRPIEKMLFLHFYAAFCVSHPAVTKTRTVVFTFLSFP